MDLNRLLSGLARLKPDSRAANRLRWDAERALMKMLNGDGLLAVERMVAKHPALQVANKAAGTRTWRQELDGGGRMIQIHVTSNRSFRASAVTYLRIPKPSAAQLARHAVQERFYERYMAIGRRAYAKPPGRISAMERRLLLVGELEADVNNGGFSQYLFNKGTRRARAAVAALEAIGAKQTAGMLRTAMAPGIGEKQLFALDKRFCAAPEDLAMLAARHARL